MDVNNPDNEKTSFWKKNTKAVPGRYVIKKIYKGQANVLNDLFKDQVLSKNCDL